MKLTALFYLNVNIINTAENRNVPVSLFLYYLLKTIKLFNNNVENFLQEILI